MIFLPTFLDSSNFWNIDHSQLQLQQFGTNIPSTTTPSPDGPGHGGCKNKNQEGFMTTAGAGSCAGGGGNDSCGGVGDDDCRGSGNSKSMPMSERARLAQLPQPVPGLNCPRYESTNTKFCYFNNYSLTQPRHFCRYCTRGGALRNVPIRGGYRLHAKRRAKPKVVSDTSRAATVGTSSMTSIVSRSTTYAIDTSTVPLGLQYTMIGSAPPDDSQFTNNLEPTSLGLSFPAGMLLSDSRACALDIYAHHHHHHAHGNVMDSGRQHKWTTSHSCTPWICWK